MFLLRCPLPPGDPLLARATAAGGTVLTSPAAVPGTSLPRPLATWMDAGGFHARFLVRPGSSVRASRLPDLSDWSDPSDLFTMPCTTNILQVDQPAAAPVLFLRLQREPLTATDAPDLLTLPADGPWVETGPPQPEEPVGTPATLPWP